MYMLMSGVTMLQGEGESKAAADPKAFGRPRLSSIGHVYAGLSDEEVEVRSSGLEHGASPNEDLQQTLGSLSGVWQNQLRCTENRGRSSVAAASASKEC